MLWVSIIVGAIFGSFLNVVLFKKNTGESAVVGRSRCFSCGKNLSWFELIPILSFFIQKGRCGLLGSGCGSRISWQYLVIELLTTGLSIILAIRFMPYALNNTYSLWLIAYGFYFAAFCVLLLIAVYDFRHKIIDKHFLYIFGGFTVVEFIFKHFNFSTVLASTTIFLFFYLLWRVSNGKWMGRGDSELAFFLALFLGHPLSFVMLILSFWLGAVVGIFLLILKSSRFTIKSEVPFGPFLAIGTFVAWYLKDFFTIIYEFLYF